MKLSEITKNSILYVHNTKLEVGNTDIYLAPVKEIKNDIITIRIKNNIYAIKPDMNNDMWIDDDLGLTFYTTLQSAAMEVYSHALIMASYWEDKIKSMAKYIKK